MSLWVTLYRWLCHCRTPCVGGYVIVGHPVWVAMSLQDTLYRWLCHCGTPYIGGYVIVGHPVCVAMSFCGSVPSCHHEMADFLVAVDSCFVYL